MVQTDTKCRQLSQWWKISIGLAKNIVLIVNWWATWYRRRWKIGSSDNHTDKVSQRSNYVGCQSLSLGMI